MLIISFNRFRLFSVVCACLLLMSVAGCKEKNAPTLELSGPTMGTTWHATVTQPGKLTEDALKSLVEIELGRVNALMSTYDPASELSQFNQYSGVEWRPMSAETIKVIEAARRISKQTSGAYDVTLGSVSALWGFGTDNADVVKPALDDILLLLNDVGYQLLEVSSSRDSVRKLNPELQIDLSSLAKGYAADQIGEKLEALGHLNYLIEIGGEIRTRGLAADGGRWKIGIEWPESAGKPTMTGIAVGDAHVASSGDYRNYRIIDGERYTHIIDGRSGFPITHELASVTVLHGSVMRADAWATAFMVLGFDDAVKLAEKKGLAARFVLRAGDGYRIEATSAFKAYAINEG